MLVLLDHPVPASVRPLLRYPEVLHRPLLVEGAYDTRAEVLARERPDVLLTYSVPEASEAAVWRAATGERPLLVVALGEERGPGAQPPWASGGRLPASVSVHPRIRVVVCPATGTGEPAEGRYARALALAERTLLIARVRPTLADRVTSVRPGAASVALVGAGVVNLLTGLWLLRAGHRVTFYDGAPDPRSGAPWAAYGCSRGGGDARMFTLTEADGYYGNPVTGSPVPFTQPVKDGGWGLADLARLSPRETAWAEENARVPAWLARSFTEDVLSYNLAAQRLWRTLMREEPSLFRDVGLREGVLRLYSDPAVLESHAARQRALTGQRCEVMSSGQVGDRHPALADAHRAGAFVGGIEVQGFTVQVHRFVDALVGLVEGAGAVFHWERPVDGLVPDADGLPDGLRRGESEIARADHYVLSPGAYGDALLRDTATEGLIHGVAGVWLTLPDVGPGLTNSLKISRSGHTAADANVTVTGTPDGRSWLTVGSGYGWTGAAPDNIDPAQLEALYAAVDDTAAAFFPEAFDRARRSGLLDEGRRHCVRPWTASSLPVFEIGRTARGGLLIVTGGHNTGGFAQAPVTAEAVATALRGKDHPMHTDYHPDRLRMFYGRDEGEVPA